MRAHVLQQLQHGVLGERRVGHPGGLVGLVQPGHAVARRERRRRRQRRSPGRRRKRRGQVGERRVGAPERDPPAVVAPLDGPEETGGVALVNRRQDEVLHKIQDHDIERDEDQGVDTLRLVQPEPQGGRVDGRRERVQGQEGVLEGREVVRVPAVPERGGGELVFVAVGAVAAQSRRAYRQKQQQRRRHAHDKAQARVDEDDEQLDDEQDGHGRKHAPRREGGRAGGREDVKEDVRAQHRRPRHAADAAGGHVGSARRQDQDQPFEPPGLERAEPPVAAAEAVHHRHVRHKQRQAGHLEALLHCHVPAPPVLVPAALVLQDEVQREHDEHHGRQADRRPPHLTVVEPPQLLRLGYRSAHGPARQRVHQQCGHLPQTLAHVRRRLGKSAVAGRRLARAPRVERCAGGGGGGHGGAV